MSEQQGDLPELWTDITIEGYAFEMMHDEDGVWLRYRRGSLVGNGATYFDALADLVKEAKIFAPHYKNARHLGEWPQVLNHFASMNATSTTTSEQQRGLSLTEGRHVISEAWSKETS